MRLSYNNLLKTADISSDSENGNYPVENLYHVWKKKTFKAEDTSCTITVTFDEISDISSVCMAYHNLSSATVNFYDDSDTLLDSWDLDCNHETEAQYGSVSNVAYADVVCSSSYDVQIGVLFIGDSIYAKIESDQDIPLSSTDNVTSSTDRQISGRKGSVTRSATITIPYLSASERKEMEYSFYECGLITPFFLDLWNSSHDSFEPIYCVYTDDLSVTHKETYDEITISVQEAN